MYHGLVIVNVAPPVREKISNVNVYSEAENNGVVKVTIHPSWVCSVV